MATTARTRCVKCNKEKATIRCGGCLKEFCYDHWEPHRQELDKQFDKIEINRDLFRQSLTQYNEQSNNSELIKQINQWEENSIKLIQQTAEEARQILFKNTNEFSSKIEIKLNELTNQLQQSRVEDDFNEINLDQFQKELDKLSNELTKPSFISIREDSTSFINRIFVHISKSVFESNVHYGTKWIQNGVVIVEGNGFGNGPNKLSHPFGVYIDDDQNIYVADAYNHRIVEWKKGATSGQVVAGGNGSGSRTNQLNWPTDVILNKQKDSLIICDRGNRRIMKWPLQNGTNGQIIISNIDCCRVTMDNDEHLYVIDSDQHEVRKWKIGDTNGILVVGGNGKGDCLYQLHLPTFIFVDKDHSVYVSDWHNHRVMKWIEGAKEGIVVAGGHGEGNDLKQLSRPHGVIVDHLDTIYVADCGNHRIMRWFKGATQGSIIAGGHGKGRQANRLNYPMSLSFDPEGNLCVVDLDNGRLQRFNIDQS